MGKNLLITGVPGVGKTTVLRRVAEAMSSSEVRGFLTDEIRDGGARVGFRIRTLDGRTATLAHVRPHAPHHVGRYAVDVGALDQIMSATLVPEVGIRAYLVDEIGKMECLSPTFVSAVSLLAQVRDKHRNRLGRAGLDRGAHVLGASTDVPGRDHLRHAELGSLIHQTFQVRGAVPCSFGETL